jgi:hypothetical protein
MFGKIHQWSVTLQAHLSSFLCEGMCDVYDVMAHDAELQRLLCDLGIPYTTYTHVYWFNYENARLRRWPVFVLTEGRWKRLIFSNPFYVINKEDRCFPYKHLGTDF